MYRNYKFYYFIWISLLVIIILLIPFKIPGEVANSGGILIAIHALATVGLLMATSSRYSLIFVGAFIVRICFMYWDIYGKSVFILPNSGGDSEFYYYWAVKVSENLNFLSESIRGGIYSKILGVLFYITGPMRIMAQYINVLLGLSTVIVVYNILINLKINIKSTRSILLVAAFFPNSVIMSGILLREIFPTFFVAVSLFYFVKWYNNNKLLSFIWSIVYLGIASMFHSGVVAIAIGYLLMFLFYNRINQKFELSFRNILFFIPVLILIFMFTTQFGDFIFYKFRTLEDPSDIYENVKIAAGGSAYLKGLTINSPNQFIIFSPVRAFYFLFSPLPMNWRGIVDILTFFIDSSLYFYILYKAIKYYKSFRNNKKLILILILIILFVSFVFGIGVSNSGTAMRHRQKLIPVFLVLYGIILNEINKVKMLRNHGLKNNL